MRGEDHGAEDAAVEHAAEQLQARLGAPPDVAVVLGSGLSAVHDRLAQPVTVDFDAVGLPAPQVAGHRAIASTGALGGRRVALLAGRVHLYEGYAPRTVVRYVRALHRWGVPRLLLTCATGGLRPDFDTGRLVVVRDHLNLMGTNPLIGPAYGERFPDLTHAYDPALRDHLRTTAASLGIDLREGVYAAMPGPAYETPSESRMLAQLGADVVGMSTVPEVLAARALGVRCAVVAAVANLASGLSTSPLTHEEVTEGVQAAARDLGRLLTEAIPRLP